MDDDPSRRPALDAHAAAGARTREGLFRQVVESISTGILVLDEAGRIVECNAAAERALGYEPGGVLGRTPSDPHWHVVSEDRQEILPEDHPGPRCLRTGEPVTEEVLGAYGGDGEFRWLRVEAMPLHTDDGGALLGVAVLFEDITEQREIAEELARTEKRLALAREAAAMGLWEWDVESGAIWHDEGIAGILAGSVTTVDEWIGHIHPDDRAHQAEQVAAVLGGRPASEQHYRVVALDGQEKHVVARGVVVEWDGDRPVRIAGSMVDATQLREATEQAQHLLDRMTDAYFVVDADWRFTYVNAQAERLLGQTRQQMVGASIWDVFADAVGSEFERQYQLAMDGQSVEFEAYYSGLDAWYEVRAHPVRGAIAVYFRDVSARHRDAEVQDALLRATQAAKAELAYAASHDSLTDLPNRPASAAWLAERLAEARTESVAVLFVDLDRFKLVNDTHGHAEGDELLVEAARRLQALCPPDGLVGRLGGDEFVLASPDRDRSRAHDLAAEVLEAFRAPFQVSGRWLVVTASIGIAYGDSGTTPTTVLRDADAALYQAKDAGRNRVGVFDDEVRRQVVDRLHIEADLRDALTSGELFPHVQPVFDARTGEPLGVEMLARWHHATRGMVPPDEFIPVAEETGLIVPLGEQMLDAAFATYGDVSEALGRPGTTWVNVSARQLEEPGFVDGLLTRVQTHGDRRSFGIEITERVLVMNAMVAQVALRELSSAGVKVAIDDFGTGYSSFARLGLYPVDLLKVDRSFVTSAVSPRGRAMTAAIIELAHALGAKACAEGVETTEQLAAVRDLGVDQVSGYLLCRPGPVDALAAGVQAAARVLAPTPATG